VTGTPGIALVTGAGSGIGRAVAIGLQKAGWTVFAAGRRRETLDETARLAGAGVHPVVADVTEEASVDNLFAEIERIGKRLDLLFNNAGVNAPRVPLDELDTAALREVIAVNLLGSMLCARAAMRQMKRQTPQGGRIINNGSVSAHAPRPNSAPYTATKHAITGLTKSISLDGRAFGIVCGQIDIGNAAVARTAHLGTGTPQAGGGTLAEPMMPAEQVAAAVAYMAGLPLDVDVPFMTLMAAGMPLYGRG
jgi:NAD(P)-dependent dehydrogenase (short-subunit alcohol dehydrogenase family)